MKLLWTVKQDPYFDRLIFGSTVTLRIKAGECEIWNGLKGGPDPLWGEAKWKDYGWLHIKGGHQLYTSSYHSIYFSRSRWSPNWGRKEWGRRLSAPAAPLIPLLLPGFLHHPPFSRDSESDFHIYCCLCQFNSSSQIRVSDLHAFPFVYVTRVWIHGFLLRFWVFLCYNCFVYVLFFCSLAEFVLLRRIYRKMRNWEFES